MEYYNPIDNSSKRYAAAVTLIILALIVAFVSQLTFEIELRERSEYAVLIEYVDEQTEEPVEEYVETNTRVEQPRVVTPQTPTTQAFEKEATDNTTTETSGEQEKTQTLNPNALFKPTAGITPDEEVTAGNRLAPDGDTESHKGEGTGLNVTGSAEFDAGLASRGVVAGYPRPKGNKVDGKVVVEVTVDSDGKVISASVRQQGTTTNDPELRANALNAARSTRFKPDPTRMTQSGTISYRYRVK